MARVLWEHALSLTLFSFFAAVFVFHSIAGWLVDGADRGYWQYFFSAIHWRDVLADWQGDAFLAFVLLVLSGKLPEKDAPEAKEPEEAE